MSTHDGWVKPFSFLRIDNFSMQTNEESHAFPLYYLLTHAHSDHLNGLNAKGFNGKLYMTAPTKQLVLDWMEAQERVRYAELGNRIKPSYKFANLEMRRRRPRGSGSAPSIAQQIVTIAYNQPFELEGPDGKPVRVVAIDANHCPGSCMYLIEGKVDGREHNVLVTGDIRIDADYLETLRRNPFLQPYMRYETPTERAASSSELFAPRERATSNGGDAATDARPRKRTRLAPKPLYRIWLDTSQVGLDEPLVPKEQAVADLIDLIGSFPDDTLFFLNAWTHGYEDMLKGIYRAYGEKIHVDWHKGKMYTSNAMRQSDPLLADLVHPDPMPSTLPHAAASHPPFVGRFHACERRWKCDEVWQHGVGCYCWEDEYQDHLQGVKKLRRPGSGERLPGQQEKLVVNVNPAEMPQWMWDEYLEEKKGQIARWKAQQAHGVPDGGKAVELPTSIVVPLARHSSLPELRSLVALFNPMTIYPLTCSHPKLYKMLPSIFGDLLAPGGKEQVQQEALKWAAAYAARQRQKLLEATLEEEDEHDGLIVPGLVADIAKKGLNVEGGEAAIKEYELWLRELQAQAATRSATPAQHAPQAGPSKRHRDDDADEDGPNAGSGDRISSDWVHVPRATEGDGGGSDAESAGGKEQNSGSSQQEPVEAANPEPDSLPAMRAGPPRMPSPFLHASQAEPPRLMSPFRMESSASPSIASGGRAGSLASISLSNSTAPRRRPSPELEVTPRTETSPSSAIGSPSSSSRMLAPVKAGPVQSPVASERTVSLPTKSPTASGSSSGAVLPPSSQIDRQQRKLYVEAFYRRFRGKIGVDGRIVPFEEGDPRLKGRRPLKTPSRPDPEQKEDQAVQLSPGSFRTVSATVSP
ncbi:hypothetical protein BMF94_1068 [Rhodotorula taiwanensis]|uniref:DNA repair metallo-beta-lactamase domain-containing protein n=1 Tax=Rhodotorula taiwanensis TaxID=741276 RepID=A0A2S5BGV8_9BASI|nr:hypothetical protein BMF94_1068 [Rhodotorula taiwanensis]